MSPVCPRCSPAACAVRRWPTDTSRPTGPCTGPIGLLLAGRHDAVDREQVEAAIVEATRCDPSEDDLRQMAAKLAAGGWPLTGFHD
ncbi:DUF3349 domain-containing protein [Nocardia aobensis]|uniref:DUF3349 domain-containing protein n=1 Tax=Nocardia aobensis TaxID=257277 RepID=A0ABW6P4Z3_9NOCA